MEHDATTGAKSSRPSLVSSNNKTTAAGVNILSNIEGSKKAQQVQKPARSGVKMLLVSATLILGSGAIAYQLLSADVAPPKLEITSAQQTTPKEAVPVASAQVEDVAQIVNVAPPEHAPTQADTGEAKNLAETKLEADSTQAQTVASSATPFDGLGELTTHQATQASQTQKPKQQALEVKKSELQPTPTANNQVAFNANAAPATQKETKPQAVVAKSEPVREAAKPKPKAKDHDAELIAAIISHEKVAPKSNAHLSTRTDASIARSNKNSTLKVAQSGTMSNLEGIDGLMAQCENLDFIEKMSCRHDACAGYWGKDSQCPTDEMAEKVLGRQNKY